MGQIPIKRQGRFGRWLDYCLLPLMYIVQGNVREVPQRTHRWNNQHLQNVDISSLEADKVVITAGDTAAKERWLGPIPRFHIPLLGGWKKFVVLQPQSDEEMEWFVGWVAFDALGVSNIPLRGPVRMGIGPRQGQFFGLNASGEQVDIQMIGEGRIGAAGEYSNIPLL